MTTDRELLQSLAAFLANRTYSQSDEDSIRDMLTRYKNPPFTLYYRVAMRLTVNDHNRLQELLAKVNAHLAPVEDKSA